MSRDHEGNAVLILLAFVMGSITGAAVALLATPTSGREARRILNEKASEGREKAEVAVRQSREFVRRQRDQLSTAVDRGREAYQRAREDGGEAANQRAREDGGEAAKDQG
jgi:gas vesicle protein